MIVSTLQLLRVLLESDTSSPSHHYQVPTFVVFYVLKHQNSVTQGGAVRRTNLVTKRHASKICTRAMFEEFGRLLIEGMATMSPR